MKKACVIVTCLSTFSRISFCEYEVESKIEKDDKVYAILTNEAGTQSLLRQIVSNENNEESNVDIKLILLESPEVRKFHKTKRNETEEGRKNVLLNRYKKEQCGIFSEKLSCIDCNEPLSEVKYFMKRMKYEWEKLEADDKFVLQENFSHILMTSDDNETCESDFMDIINCLKNEYDEIEVYMDETGGPRDINYTFSLLLRMLEYTGVTCKDIVYSNINNSPNEIKSVKQKQNYVDIISGLDEFVKYGKTDMLRACLKKMGTVLDKDVTQLLNAMQQYSEQLTLCNVDNFKKANSDLKDAIDNFYSTESINGKYVLKLLLPELERKIALDDDKHRVPFLVRNCIKNDMLQQAITIYNELVPEYLIEELRVLLINGIVNVKGDSESRSKLEALLHGMQIGDCSFLWKVKKKEISMYSEKVREIVQAKRKYIYLDKYSGYQKLFSELLRQQGDEKDYGKYTATYYILKNIDLFSEQIKFPKNNKEKVIEVIMDYLQIREIRNSVNHASGIEEKAKDSEMAYRKKYFELPVFQQEALTYAAIKKSLEKANEHLEELTK